MGKEYTALEDIMDIEVMDINNKDTTVGKLIAQLDNDDLIKLKGMIVMLMGQY